MEELKNSTCELEQEAGKLLGKQVAPDKEYNPNILVPFSRKKSLESCGIDIENVPYDWYGLDIWNLWEIRYKDPATGRSVSRVGTLVYDAKSERMIESKSMKLYFMSLAYEKLHKHEFINTVTNDIASRINSPFTYLNVYDRSEYYSSLYKADEEVEYWLPERVLNKTEKDVVFIDVGENVSEPEFISAESDETDSDISDVLELRPSYYHDPATGLFKRPVTIYVYDAGASNCLVTKQKDYATDIIIIDNTNVPSEERVIFTEESLNVYLQYFEDVNRFHESTCHTIFDRLVRKIRSVTPQAHITVLSAYTRRGGIDINPFRTTDFKKYSEMLNYVTHYSWTKFWNQ